MHQNNALDVELKRTSLAILALPIRNESARRAIRISLGSVLLLVLWAANSFAQAQRTFVSGGGSDSNPCSRTAPCRTFTQAISQTAAGGEVIVLDSAGYGPFTITQAVTVQAPAGVYAGITVFSGTGITVNAAAGDSVILRGLTVNSQGTGGDGIDLNGGNLHVESCVVNGFSHAKGLFMSETGKLEVKDSILRGNDTAIQVTAPMNTAEVTIDNVRLEFNLNGLEVRERARVTIRNSVISNNSDDGVSVQVFSTASAELTVENCVVSHNSAGVFTESGNTGVATIRISNSTVTNNGTGLNNFASPAQILSRGNNTIEGNGNDMVGTMGTYSGR